MKSSYKMLLALLGCCLGAPAVALADSGDLRVYDLVADWANNPIGVDASPKLSWKLESDERGARQSAWQILAASSRGKLAQDDGDLWDSGKVEGSEQIQVRYGGSSLESGQQVFWKVRSWDADGEPSPWSKAATWTVGLKSEDDWQAEWIAHPEWLQVNRPHLGYRSQPAEDVNTPKWVKIDLGAIHPIDSITLRAVRYIVAERLGFPREFVVEAAVDAAFDKSTVIADTVGSPTNPWRSTQTLDAQGVEGRYVRVTAPVLRELDGDISLALSQIEVHSGGKNVAVGATVTTSDSLEEGMWSKEAVVDGKGVPGSNPLANKTVRLRKELEVQPDLERALVYVSGLGAYMMEINGEELDERRLSPGWTNTRETVLYDGYDVTSLLREGGNAIGLTLASDMYSVSDPGDRYTKFVGRFRPLMAIAQVRLEYADGSVEIVGTDESWQATEGPVTYSHVYGGEDYDARLDPEGWSKAGFHGRGWMAAVVTDGPGGYLRGASHAHPPIRVIEELEPVAKNEIRPGVTVYDLGQNTSLMLRLTAEGPAGSRVRVIPAELLEDDGTVDRGSAGGGSAWWQFTLAGTGSEETWDPDFFYHGSRYLQVERMPAEEGGELPEVKELVGLVTHTSADPVGHFATSSNLFNETRELIRWAQRSNAMSVLTDCPHRERLGWLEQYHLNGPSVRYEFDHVRLFNKTFQDMVDAQTKNGLVPDIAPEYIVFSGDFRDSPEWGSAIIQAAWQQYMFTGDERAVLDIYNEMQHYFEYLASKADGHILDHGLGDWYDLGPEGPGYSQLTPIALTATATYYQNAKVLEEVAKLRRRDGETVAYADRAENIRKAFNEKFFDAEKGSYATGSQTSNAMPYVLGMVPEGREGDVLDAIIADIRERGNQLTSGDVGHRYLLMALARGGRSDVIMDMHHQTDRPGYGWQLERGKTSLTEAWDGGSSQNHFMLGHIMEWFYHDLVGIAPDSAQPGFANVVIKPQAVDGISWAEGSYDSIRGPVRVRWERDGSNFSLNAEVPANATATVYVPAADATSIQEDGRAIDDREDVVLVRQEDGVAVYQIGSGSYEFEVR